MNSAKKLRWVSRALFVAGILLIIESMFADGDVRRAESALIETGRGEPEDVSRQYFYFVLCSGVALLFASIIGLTRSRRGRNGAGDESHPGGAVDEA